MITTINFLILAICILVGLNAFAIKSLVRYKIKVKSELEKLDDYRISQNRHMNSIRQDIDSIMFELRETKNTASLASNNKFHIDNLSRDLDQTIGTIDQVQEKIAELNVTLENIANELNKQKP